MALIAATFLHPSQAPSPIAPGVVANFVNAMPNRVDALKRMLRAGAWEEIGRYAYRLKKAAAEAGFVQLAPLTTRLEQAARGGEPEEAVRQAIEQLIAECQTIRKASR